MKFLIIATLFTFSIFLANAQEKFIAIPSAKGAVIEYVVAPKESLYSLSRKFNVKVLDLAVANGFDKDKGLIIGQKVKIPLSAENLNQQDRKGAPVYYTVGEKENLTHVSNRFYKAPLKNLRSWNNLKKNELNKGQALIIGYLPGVAAPATVKTEKQEAASKDEKSVAKKEEKPATATTKKDEKPPVAKKDEKQSAKEVRPKAESAAAEKIVAKNETEPPAKPKTEIDETGFFKQDFDAHTNPAIATSRTVNSGIFKTDRGWNDGKYYALMDDVTPGTVVKISNPETGKIVYAKVLGQLKDVKYSDGLGLRMSEAAASVLKINDSDKFTVRVTY